jgi:HTH-type transcriptional regulator / antitoxin HipB
MEGKVNYPIKTLSQLPLILKGFRKERGLTQAAIAEKLGITQQSYAYFEANPATATLDRLFTVLSILGVEISLNQASFVKSISRIASEARSKNIKIPKTRDPKIGKIARAETIKKKNSPNAINLLRVISSTKKKESW